MRHMEGFVHNECFIISGELRIYDDGSIWRVKERRRDGKLRRCAAHRAECVNDKSGYLRVHVTVGGKRISIYAHRLVYFHFYGAIPGELTINHWDGNPGHNAPTNLKLATHLEQARHARDVLGHTFGALGGRNANSKLNTKTAAAIKRALRTGEAKASIARRFGVSWTTIHNVSRGRTWSAA